MIRRWLAAMFAPPAWMREQQRREDRALVRALDAAAKEYQQQEGQG